MTPQLEHAISQERELLLLGMALALVASLFFNLGLALQKAAAQSLPPVGGAALGALRHFARSRRWLISAGVIAIGWTLQLTALSFAPLGLVMPTVAAGVASQAWIAPRFFGEKLSRSDWAGVACCVVGIVAMGLSLGAREWTGVDIDWGRLLAAIAALIALALVVALLVRGREAWIGTGLATAAGLLYATTGLLGKALGIGVLREESWFVGGATLALMFAIGGLAIVVLQAAHQRGRAIVVVPLMGILADFVPAFLGPVLFAEPWPTGGAALLRWTAFGVIALGVLFLARPVARMHEPT